MEKNLLLDAVNCYTSFSPDEAQYFLSIFEPRTYKRNSLLLSEGKVAHEVFFVAKGALRQFFYTEDGLERTCNFCFERGFLTDLESFSRQSRSATSIITLEKSELMVTTCVALAKALQQSTAIAEFFRVVVENVAQESIKRTKSMLSHTLEKQFEELINHNPQIIQRVPQRYIAQYLGIAPESLSRIRKRMMEQQKS